VHDLAQSRSDASALELAEERDELRLAQPIES
jgi:hypothetical protein